MMRSAGIVGAGIQGRLLAWRLALNGWRVTLFDKNKRSGKGSCSYAAGGMLAPVAECLTQDHLIYELGYEGIAYWQAILSQLSQPVFFQRQGTLMLAHSEDYVSLLQMSHRLQKKVDSHQVQILNSESLHAIEPDLNFKQACFLTNEAQIDARNLLNALAHELKIQKVACHFDTAVSCISSNTIVANDRRFSFDWIFDCRGAEACSYFSDLRCVRGELIYLHAPQVQIKRVIRLLHPRYPIYIIPRPNHHYLVGATEIESADDSPLSVRSALELLSAAYSVHSGFGEARILESVTALRPAFSNNLPQIHYELGLIRINGLYRHGFLIAPILAQEAIRLCEQGPRACVYLNLIQEDSRV